MSSEYTLNDLLTNDKINIYRLNTKVLQDYFTAHISPNAYTFNLLSTDNNQFCINLVFTEAQFCHLIGFHNFGHEGIDGWNTLHAAPKKIVQYNSNPEFNMMQFRITGFNQLHTLLQSPDIYIYKAADHPEFRYKSEYFAVLVKNNKYFKLGIGSGSNAIHYPETYIVDMDKPQYNYYLEPDNKLIILNKAVMPTKDFFDQRLLNNIKELHAAKFPGIKYINVETAKLIDTLNKEHGFVLSIKEIKGLYTKAGQAYEQDRCPANLEVFKIMTNICRALKTAYELHSNEAAASNEPNPLINKRIIEHQER
jgi:hypothetical protein